jgi:hypothetical protein
MDLAMKRRPDHQVSLIRRSFDYMPPAGFDPLTASQDELAKFGIVPRPDRKSDPVSFRHWLRIFAPPMTFVAPKLREERAMFRLNPSTPKKHTAAVISASRYDTSRNWSGAYVVPTDDTMFVLVAGLWAIPDVTLPPAEFQQPGATQYVCSTWVGLDGQRKYLNSSLPQAGTMQFLTLPNNGPPQASAVAFFEWWDQEDGGTFLQLNGLPVHPGDVMLGAVWAKDKTTAIAYLRNLTTGTMAIVGATAPVVQLSGNPPVELTISGATAEWILERPTEPHTTTLHPFPAYSTTTFSCWAGAAPTAGPPQIWHDLQRARFIRLFDTLPDPTRTVFISMPDWRSNGAVRLEYGDFKD